MMTGIGHNTGAVVGDKLREYVERIERLDSEKANLSADIKEIYAQAKSAGYDTKIVRKLIAERKRDTDDVAEEEALLETYRRALGALASTPLGGAALAAVAARNGATA